MKQVNEEETTWFNDERWLVVSYLTFKTVHGSNSIELRNSAFCSAFYAPWINNLLQ